MKSDTSTWHRHLVLDDHQSTAYLHRFHHVASRKKEGTSHHPPGHHHRRRRRSTVTTIQSVLWMLVSIVLTKLTSIIAAASTATTRTNRALFCASSSSYCTAIRHLISQKASSSASLTRSMASSSASSSSLGDVKSVADLRKEYSMQGLEESSVPKEPFSLFRRWLDDAVAAKVIEPNAMCLSTVGPEGRPSGRFVLLKGLDDQGFVWYTNYESRKSGELTIHPFASLTFWWGDLERSVRIEGRVEKVSEEESSTYFWSRPRGSQMGAWASNQSRSIPSRQALEAQYEAIQANYADESQTIPKPPHWGGFRLLPNRVEFWKGRQLRLHDRIVYTLEEGGNWKTERLQP